MCAPDISELDYRSPVRAKNTKIWIYICELQNQDHRMHLYMRAPEPRSPNDRIIYASQDHRMRGFIYISKTRAKI